MSTLKATRTFTATWAWRRSEADRIARDLNERIGRDAYRVTQCPWMRWGRKHYVVTDVRPETDR